MTRIYRIPTSQVDGNGSNDNNTSEIRPYGEISFYIGDNNKLELLMFDGLRTHLKSKVLNKGTFYGGDADSSDGLSYDTIKFVPDEVLRRNGSDQYLVVDPTSGEPGHIHIRSGGTIDNSSADLFLGGEKNHVRVSDTNDRVVISTDKNDGSTSTWIFSGNGTLTLPSNLSITPAGNFIPVPGTAILQGTDEWILIVSSGTNATTQLGWAEDPFAASQSASISFNANNSGEVRILTGSFTSTVNTWAFGIDGKLIFPDGTTSTGATIFANSSSFKIQTISFDGSPSNIVSTYEFGVSSITIPGNGTIYNEGFPGAWGLDGANSSFTFPNNSRITYGLSNVGLTEDDLKIQAINTGNVVISANGEDWVFGTDGNLTFPDSTVQTTAFVVVDPPTSSTSTGAVKTISFDSSYFYVCTATNSWQRIAWDSTPW